MVYRKRSNRTRPRRRPRRRYSRKKPESTGMWLAKQAWKGVKLLKDVVNTEYKRDDVFIASNYDYTGTIYSPCTNISQGTAETQRIGSSLKLQNLVFRCELTRNGADANIRLIWFWDDQNQITSSIDLLQAAGTVYSTVSPKNYSNRFRTKILMDRNYNLTTDSPQKNCYATIPINRHVNFAANTTTIQTGALKLLIISDVVTSNLPAAKFFQRISFTDN